MIGGFRDRKTGGRATVLDHSPHPKGGFGTNCKIFSYRMDAMKEQVKDQAGPVARASDASCRLLRPSPAVRFRMR